MKSAKLTLLSALTLFLLFGVAPAVRADWDPGQPHKMHHPQLPNPEGWDVCIRDQWVADDFECSQTAPIEDIHFWVSWRGDDIGDIDSIEPDISIWSDSGGRPGMRLWTWNWEGDVTGRFYGTGIQGWVCPGSVPPEMIPGDHQMFFQVNITNIKDPFTQIEGTTYWLVVKANMPTGPVLGWKTSASEPPLGPLGPIWGSPAQWSMGPDTGAPWQPVETGTTTIQLHDMAFVITGEPTFIPYEPPTLQVGPWLVCEDWHRWISPDDTIPVHLQIIDPCNDITHVDFSWAFYDPAGGPLDWHLFYTDTDGNEPTLTTLPDPYAPPEGDGWKGYLEPGAIPMPGGNEPVRVVLKAEGYTIDSFFDITYEIELDPSPPDKVEVITEVQDDTLIVDVNPNPDYPQDIDYVVVEVEPKEEYYQKPIPRLNQLNDNRLYDGGYHCAPTATAACLKYFEGQGDPDIAGGLSGDDLTDALAEAQGTNKGGKGTGFSEWVNGTKNWIDDHGGGYSVRSGSFDWKTARDELERCQDVLVRLEWPSGFGHALTLSSVHNTPQADGTIRIDLMDPYGGTTSEGDLNPNTGGFDNFEGASGNRGTFSHMIIICPEEEGPGGGGGGSTQPGPDPAPIPIPLPDPGKYFVRVTVVDVTNHAATLISIVERNEPEFGDAPEGALAYPSTCKMGAFPTCMNVGPAMWIQHFSSGRLFFGPLVDSEPEGNAGFCPMFNPNTYNQDECFGDADAGLIKPPAYTIVGPVGSESVVPCITTQTGSLGTVCQPAVWGANIDIHVTNNTPAEAYVNVLVDWNKSGEWSGQSTCPPCLGGAMTPEHILVDFPIPPGHSGPISMLMPAGNTFLIGPYAGYVWTRFTVTPNRMGNGWPGDGEFSDGETEDYLIQLDPAPQTQECDWNEGDDHKMHHPQLPDLSPTGIDVDMFWTPLADDFMCSESGKITDIHFWGSFADDCLPPGGPGSLTFQVTIYSDIPATIDHHSMPGDVLWGPRVFTPCEYTVERMPDGPEDWYDPITGVYFQQNHFQAYQYNICIDDEDVFHQEKGTIYWLEIKDLPDAGFEPDYTFGWKTTQLDLRWNDDAVYRPTAGGWAELKYPEGHVYHPESLDLAFVITGEPDPEPDIDWGDAPDPTYPTWAASLGASHTIVPGIFMGNTVDRDPDGQPTANADGDDIDSVINDEDGVTFDTPLIPGQPAQITVNASQAGPFISIWIDYGADGGWAEAEDYVVQSQMATVAGNNSFPFVVPATAVPGRTYVRVRFTTNPQIGFSGHATNGEVEDYLVTIEAPYEPKPPVPHLKWSQPPIELDPVPGVMPTYCGWDQLSLSTKELAGQLAVWQMAADDFRCLGRMPITSIHWWGSYKNWTEQDIPPGARPVSWRIGFWSNAPIDALHPYSRPEKLLHVITVDPSQVEEIWVGMDMFPDPDILPESCFQYYVQLMPEDYFWQDSYIEDNNGDTVFWISITAVYEGFPGPEYPWGWKTRPEHWMDDAVAFSLFQDDLRVGQVLDPATITPLEATVCEEPESYDLAFELDTDPNYIKWEQPFTGLRHWPHYEDEESMGQEIIVTPTKHEQLPDVTLPGLHCHDSVFGQITLADDWNCEGGEVTDLHWYGNYEVDALGQEKRGRGIQSFHLSIHDNASPECLPAEPEVMGIDILFAEASETYTGLINNEGCRIYRYDYDLPNPFPQEEGRKYWFDIAASCVEPANPAIWRWQEAGRTTNPTLCGAAEKNVPSPGMWKTITWPPIPPSTENRYSDMAFAITNGPRQPEVLVQRLVADDWECTTRQPVVAAVWWGSYIGYRYNACRCLTAPRPVKPDYFLLTMWTDVPANVDLPYSHPGIKIWEYKAYEYDEVMVGYDKYPEDVPGAQYGREPVFRYSVRLPMDAWFHQEEDDAIFWFSAVAVYQDMTDPIYPWGWTNHSHVFNDDAVAGTKDPTGEWIWEELYDQTGISEDMSFILFTEPGCFPSNDPNYIEWLRVGKPQCWCFKRQCYGDSDGDKEGSPKIGYYYVHYDDLNVLTTVWKISEPPHGPGIATATGPAPKLTPGICADFAHDIEGSPKIGYFRVHYNDLNKLMASWNIAEPPHGPGLPTDCGGDL
ncbi:MAG: hypothetical protein JW720_03435 [Sedimentisphaerales bacterium]|nr:hypothetical protein [Sedimentisphaerales bacterium]